MDSEKKTKSVCRNGRFENPWDTWKSQLQLKNIFTFYTQESNDSNVPKNEEELDKVLPVLVPNLKEFHSSPESGIRSMWIGHATVLVQFDGITVLTDPMFSDRCSPSQHFGTKRYRKIPCTIEELPVINAVIISHNHYDHLDSTSVQKLNKRFGKELRWYVPQNLKTWFTNSGCENVIELDWWEDHHYSKSLPIRIICTPCQHWSKRTLFDDFKTLWSSWALIGPRHRFFFGGDTGYCESFKEIGNHFGPFTLAALPIGAYQPRWFLCPQRVDPEEAVQIHQDVKARTSIGIHWGTFTLSMEHYMEPKEKLKSALERK